MALVINRFSDCKLIEFSAVMAEQPNNLYCCLVDYKTSRIDYFFLPLSCFDVLNSLNSFEELQDFIHSHSSYAPTVTTDNKIARSDALGVVDSVGVAPLASVLSEQTNSNPSDIVVCGSGVNPPPVAVSSYPAASDTLILKIMQSQRLGAAL